MICLFLPAVENQTKHSKVLQDIWELTFENSTSVAIPIERMNVLGWTGREMKLSPTLGVVPVSSITKI